MLRVTLAALLATAASTALAQPADLPIAAATTGTYPPGVKIVRTPAGPVYADQHGRVLYGMDMRTVLRWSPDAAQFCKEDCARDWDPLLAPKDATVNIRFPQGFGPRVPVDPRYVANQTAPDWTVISGPQGPQWVYKGWHMAYTRHGAKKGDTSLDGSGGMTWNTLKFVPPVPVIVAPPGVTPALLDGGYVLTDKAGNLLVSGSCTDCAPLTAPMASAGIGQWQPVAIADRSQWTWQGNPVFAVPRGPVPKGATLLKPETGR